MRGEVIKLLEQSARQTSNRLQFFRLAFGAAGGFDSVIPLDEAEKAVRSFFSEGKVTLNWQPDVRELEKGALKILLNMTLLAGETLIRGGDLTVTAVNADGQVTMDVVANGERIIIQDKMVQALTGELPEDAIDPKTVPAFLARQVAAEKGGRIEYQAEGGTSLRLRAVLSA